MIRRRIALAMPTRMSPKVAKTGRFYAREGWESNVLTPCRPTSTELLIRRGRFIMQNVDFLEYDTPLENAEAYAKAAL
jgi:hypothetical protein